MDQFCKNNRVFREFGLVLMVILSCYYCCLVVLDRWAKIRIADIRFLLIDILGFTDWHIVNFFGCNCEQDWFFFWGKRFKTVLGVFGQFKVQFCEVLPIVITIAVVVFVDVSFIVVGFCVVSIY